MLSVTAGSMACRSRSRKVTPALSTPIGTLSPMGSTFSHTREYKQQQKSQPENRGAGYEKGIPLNDPIRPGSPENSRQDAKDKSQNT